MEKQSHRLCEKPSPLRKRTYEYSDDVARLLRMASTLTPQETVNLCCGLIKRNRMSPANLNNVKNYIGPVIKEIKTREQQRAGVPCGSFSQEETGNTREHQSTDVSSASSSKKETDNAREHQRTDVSSASSSSNVVSPAIWSRPHNKVSLIVRADLIEEGSVLAFDTEKVTQHISRTDKTTRIVAGDFALVDLQGRVVMWCYIFRENVCVYNTQHTGLDEIKIKSGISQTTFLEILAKILKGNLLVGAAIKEDLKHLALEAKNLPGKCSAFDIQDFFKDAAGESVSLAQLGQHFTGQPFQDAAHSSLADARMTALAYKRMLKFKREGYLQFACPDFDDFRAEMKEKKKHGVFKKRWEKCRCFSTKPSFTSLAAWGDMKKLPGI